MNFKHLFLLFILTSCGVKAPPIAASEDTIPSIIEQTSNQLINSEAESQVQKKKK